MKVTQQSNKLHKYAFPVSPSVNGPLPVTFNIPKKKKKKKKSLFRLDTSTAAADYVPINLHSGLKVCSLDGLKLKWINWFESLRDS